ncbi:hypothetical protein ACLQ2N_35740, partial [Streptomyces sp. DT224]|uniref:hypothetical protein n=1 Tax=Streptomyces sp. DT224 TaxID=3393426 RepID=UPI003CEB06BC
MENVTLLGPEHWFSRNGGRAVYQAGSGQGWCGCHEGVAWAVQSALSMKANISSSVASSSWL